MYEFGAFALLLLKSTLLAFLLFVALAPGAARAHEMQPSIVDAEVSETTLRLTMILQGEAIVAGVDLSQYSDTADSPMENRYDALRALDPASFEDRFRADWRQIAQGFRLSAGDTALQPELEALSTSAGISPDLPRETQLVVTANLPDDGSPVTVAWAAAYGPMILRQIVVDLPEDQSAYSAYLGAGQASEPLPRSGTVTVSGLVSFIDYLGLGYLHIIPRGLDHILFVLGLFLFSLRAKPLLLQISTFTVAHTLTLALATLGILSIPASVVEPLIALSIVYVAVENIFQPKLSRFRLVVVFAFGLLHGLGFASILGEIGLNPLHFISSLIAFNIGVELGQISVIAAAYLAIGIWFSRKTWYRQRVVVPLSAIIALIGLWWAFERVILS